MLASRLIGLSADARLSAYRLTGLSSDIALSAYQLMLVYRLAPTPLNKKTLPSQKTLEVSYVMRPHTERGV